MSLDVDAPPAPELNAALDVSEYDDVEVGGSEYHREEIEEYLRAGAWEQGFYEWADRTELDEAGFSIVEDLGLLEEFDFFWDDFADRVGFHAPGIPENWRERDLHPELTSWETASTINAEMAELGEVVSRTLKADYVDWESDPDLPDDLPDYD